MPAQLSLIGQLPSNEPPLPTPKRTNTIHSITADSSACSSDSETTDITEPDHTPTKHESAENAIGDKTEGKIAESEETDKMIAGNMAATRPALDRTTSLFDLPKEGVERPVAYRWQAMMNRNALANPGASTWCRK